MKTKKYTKPVVRKIILLDAEANMLGDCNSNNYEVHTCGCPACRTCSYDPDNDYREC